MKARSFFKWLGIVLAGVIVLISIGFLLLPKEPRETMEFDDPYRTERTLAQSDHYMASTGTPWATETALRIMGEGGNAYFRGSSELQGRARGCCRKPRNLA